MPPERSFLLPGTPFLIFWLHSHCFSFPGLWTQFPQLYLLQGPSSERKERATGFLSYSWILGSSDQRDGFPSLGVLSIWPAIVASVPLWDCLGAGTREEKNPRGFLPLPLTYRRPFSCSSDKKERASLGTFSVCTWNVLLGFRLPLRLGWVKPDLKREKSPHFNGSQRSVCLP